MKKKKRQIEKLIRVTRKNVLFSYRHENFHATSNFMSVFLKGVKPCRHECHFGLYVKLFKRVYCRDKNETGVKSHANMILRGTTPLDST